MDSSNWTAAPTSGQECNRVTVTRSFGDSELAFYPASKDGLGDMFLHIGFNAPQACMTRARVVIAWAVIRAKQPLLECKVFQLDSSGDESIPYFSFSPPASVKEALERANAALVFKHDSKDELISNYMNGPRTLSNDKISVLFISTPEGGKNDDNNADFDLLMCAPHFTGDGTSLHQSAHELLTMLASSRSDEQLMEELVLTSNWNDTLPPAFEHRCAIPQGRFAKAAAKVNFLLAMDREMGGHVLPRYAHGPKKTIMLERDFTEEQTAIILRHCKANGVTINHVLFSLCNLVWSRSADPKTYELPMMIYTAINLRAHLTPHQASTYWFLALTYFNVVLPSFPPATKSVFWHRARSAKAQTRRILDSPGLLTCTLEMARIRASRAKGVPVSFPSIHPTPTTLLPPSAPPSSALLGLSLIGNLDAIYIRSAYPNIHLRSVTTASRQKPSGLLLLQHTFAKKLWFNLCYDVNGFEEGTMEKFWQGLQDAVEEFLC